MKLKIKIISFLCIIVSIIGVGIIIYITKIEEEQNVNKSLSSDVFELNNTSKKLEIDKAKMRMETLRKKITLKGLIANGDMYFEDKQYTSALVKYLQAYKDIPKDQEINLKIGNLYYNLNKYSKAYTHYKKIKNSPNLDKDKALKALINSSNIGTGTLLEINKEIDSFGLNKEQSFYYKNSTLCVIDFSKCRENFEIFFKEEEDLKKEAEKENESKEESESKEEIVIFQDLENIKQALINYENFQLDEIGYKSALISGAYYENGFYFLSLVTAKKILEENEKYKAILKIAAKSAYELGDYIGAKKFLIKYNKIESSDPEVSYFLGRVYEKLNENVLSIVHFNKAIRIGYENITDIQRRLIFIYFELEQTNKMLDVFKDLIKTNSEDLNINDFNLAIYYHIINNDLKTAEQFSKIGKKKFQNSELFYGYYAWILLQKEKLSDYQIDIIDKNINKGLDINEKNSIIVMTKGMLELKKENFDEAFIYFKKAYGLDKTGEYKETIDTWLNKIPKKENNNNSK